jgi:hypothetical protein
LLKQDTPYFLRPISQVNCKLTGVIPEIQPSERLGKLVGFFHLATNRGSFFFVRKGCLALQLLFLGLVVWLKFKNSCQKWEVQVEEVAQKKEEESFFRSGGKVRKEAKKLA